MTLPPEVETRVDRHWSRRLGCAEARLYEAGVSVLPHAELVGYEGVYVAAIREAVLVSAPAELVDPLAAAVLGAEPRALLTPTGLRRVLPVPASELIGPAAVAYSACPRALEPSTGRLVLIADAQVPSLQALRRGVSDRDWEWAGLDAAVGSIASLVVSGEVVSACGYRLLSEEVAHLGVLTHSDHRRLGYAAVVVSAMGRVAWQAGLLPQYQTLRTNLPALRVARHLGFCTYATTLAARCETGSSDGVAGPPDSS
jgi:GNAT superfamily N-acetyltransferase